MIIDDCPVLQPAFTQCGAMKLYRDGSSSLDDGRVQSEVTLHVSIDGEAAIDLVCTPANLSNLIIGRLYSEGIIQSIDDIASITYSNNATCANVVLNSNPHRPVQVRAKGHCIVRSTGAVDHTASNTTRQFDPVRPIYWDPEWVFSLAELLSSDTPMHRATYGTHSCFLSVGGRLMYYCEDIGRHNAFDKALGYGLAHSIDMTQALLFTSGRLPIDMVTKAISVKIPILASKAVPTIQTVEMARRHRLTLICSAHTDSLVVYNDPLGCANAPIGKRRQAQ